MSESNTNAWPFPELSGGETLDIDAIFGKASETKDTNPFDVPAQGPAAPQTQEPLEIAPSPPAEPEFVTAAPPAALKNPVPAPKTAQQAGISAGNPIAAAFEQRTVENAKKGLLEKPPVFHHKNVKEPIEDASMTFEELRIQKSDDFADLEDGKYVSWKVEYCGIRKDIKDPKGTTIISIKETIERSREFLDALRKSANKNPDCIVKPTVIGKNKGIAAYKGHFRSVEEARDSDKVICLIPSSDGRIYELQKMEQGEFIAPKNKAVEFQQVRAGFTPALPLIPLPLIGQIITFFRSLMAENDEYEAMAQIYWDKEKQRFFAFIPKQIVWKEEIKADLHDCPYDDEERYLCYADIHSHNSMEAFFSDKDDQDERGTGLYFVVGNLDRFFPGIKARIACGGSFVPIDPATVIEGLDQGFPEEWIQRVTCRKKEIRKLLPTLESVAPAKEFRR